MINRSYRSKQHHNRRLSRILPQRSDPPARLAVAHVAQQKSLAWVLSSSSPPAPRQHCLREDATPLLAPRCAQMATVCKHENGSSACAAADAPLWQVTLSMHQAVVRPSAAECSAAMLRASGHWHDPTDCCRRQHRVGEASTRPLAGPTAGVTRPSATMMGFAHKRCTRLRPVK